MYQIRYQNAEGKLTLKETHSWDEAMTCWEALMADHEVRIVPDPQTGLDISVTVGLTPDHIPHSWALIVA